MVITTTFTTILFSIASLRWIENISHVDTRDADQASRLAILFAVSGADQASRPAILFAVSGTLCNTREITNRRLLSRRRRRHSGKPHYACCKRMLRKIERRLVAGDDGKQNVLKSSWQSRDLGLLWPFSVRFYVLWVWVLFLNTLGNTLRWIFPSWSPRFPFFPTVRDARNGKRGFARRGYGNNFKVMKTMGFWLFIWL